MACIYEMDPIHLRSFEVNYELRIRNVTTTNADMPQKRRFLRRELQKDMARPGVHVYQTPNFTFELEHKEIGDSIESVTAMVNDFDGTNQDVYKRIRSRINHITGRLKRIPENISDDISGYRGDNLIIISTLEDDLEEVMDKHKQGEVNRLNLTAPPEAATTSKCFPVYKLGLKFDGDTTKQSVNSFLEELEELSFSRNVSEDELFRSAIEIFDGPAKIWYRRIRKKVESWDGLVAALRKDFLSTDSDDDLWETIRNRKQKADERVIIFISAMENLFDRLITKAMNSEKLKIIKKNLLDEYHVHLALRNIVSIDELADICRSLEQAGIIRLESRSFNPSRRNNSTVETDLAYLPTYCTNKRESKNYGSKYHSNQNEVKEVSELRCFKCKQLGHVKRNCTQNKLDGSRNKKVPRCFGCGKEGVIRPNCTCSKNARRRDAM